MYLVLIWCLESTWIFNMFNLKAILISSMVSVCPTCHRDRCSTIFWGDFGPILSLLALSYLFSLTWLCISSINWLRFIFPLWSTSTSAIIVFTCKPLDHWNIGWCWMLINLSLSWVVPKGSQQLGDLFRAKDAGAFLRQEGGITWHAANISAIREPGWFVHSPWF